MRQMRSSMIQIFSNLPTRQINLNHKASYVTVIMLLLYHVRQEFARKILRSLPAIVSCRLRYSLAEHELDDVDPPLHDKRQDDSVANLAPS